MSRSTHARLHRTLCLTLRNARATSCFYNDMRNTNTKHPCKVQSGCMIFSTTHTRMLAIFFANAFACGTGKRALLATHHSIPVVHFFTILPSLGACFNWTMLLHVSARNTWADVVRFFRKRLHVWHRRARDLSLGSLDPPCFASFLSHTLAAILARAQQPNRLYSRLLYQTRTTTRLPLHSEHPGPPSHRGVGFPRAERSHQPRGPGWRSGGSVGTREPLSDTNWSAAAPERVAATGYTCHALGEQHPPRPQLPRVPHPPPLIYHRPGYSYLPPSLSPSSSLGRKVCITHARKPAQHPWYVPGAYMNSEAASPAMSGLAALVASSELRRIPHV